MGKHFAQSDPVTVAARAMARLSRTSVRRVSWRMLASAALEAARATDARLTKADKGKAIGSANDLSSSHLRSALTLGEETPRRTTDDDDLDLPGSAATKGL